MTPTRLCLVRHGETAWNAETRIQGHLDVPLNATGVAQARAAANALASERFEAIYASDLLRARETALAIAHRLHIAVSADERLRERHYGRFQELTYAEARERHARDYARFERREPDWPLPGGESLSAFAARVRQALDDIVARHPGEQVLVVTHGGVLDIAYRRATGRDLAAPRDFPLPNAALNWLEAAGADWSVTLWGERAHLDQAMDELP